MDYLLVGNSALDRSSCCPGAVIYCPCFEGTLCNNLCIVQCINLCGIRCGTVCPIQVIPFGT